MDASRTPVGFCVRKAFYVGVWLGNCWAGWFVREC